MRRILLVLLCFLMAPASVPAQELLPNGLTRSLSPLPVTIRYENRYGRVADKVEAICRAEMPRIASELGLAAVSPIEIVVTSDAHNYDRTLTHTLPRWGVAFAVLEEQRILVDVNRATRAFNSLEEVVPHELSHLLMYQRAPGVRFPIWFMEGLAQWQAREWSLTDGWQLANNVWSGTAPRLRDMNRTYPAEESRAQAAYRVSYVAFTDLFGDGGFWRLPEFLAEIGAEGNFDRAFMSYWGFTPVEYGAWFQDDLEKRYQAKLLAVQSGPIFGLAALLFVAVIIRYAIRRRRKFAQLEE
jgi:hypothetical protein